MNSHFKEHGKREVLLTIQGLHYEDIRYRGYFNLLVSMPSQALSILSFVLTTLRKVPMLLD